MSPDGRGAITAGNGAGLREEAAMGKGRDPAGSHANGTSPSVLPYLREVPTHHCLCWNFFHWVLSPASSSPESGGRWASGVVTKGAGQAVRHGVPAARDPGSNSRGDAEPGRD